MNDEILTVILFSYNHKDTFKKAIDSVISQKTNYKYTIWILDDSSNDGTQEIINEYVLKYPNLIIAHINKFNRQGKHLSEFIKRIETKYYTILETDDYWCDENKLQEQLDILENNPDCSMCAHNTTRNYIDINKEEPYLKAQEGKYSLPKEKLTHRYYVEPHTSSRIYRTSCIDWSEVEDTNIISYDVTTVFYFITKGNLYYIDKIMSVYNYTGSGAYSSSSSYNNRYKAACGIYKINKQLKFKYNYLLARFFSTRINLNFIDSYKLKNCKNVEQLEEFYKKILNNFKNKYLKLVDKKPILSYKIPIGKKRKLSIEISREKDLC